jgi:uncharacterized protein
MKRGLKPMSQELIMARMKYENPWWVSSDIHEEYASLKRRLYFDLFIPLVTEKEIKRALVLMGPRRVGKTVVMQHAIQQLIQQGVNKHSICFISIDNPIYINMGLEQLFAKARETVKNDNPKNWYVFFDEIQYLKDWEIHLKVLVDSYPKTKFIVSGSAAAALKLKSDESGAGRFTEFVLPPLTFQEYIHLKDLNHLVKPTKMSWQGNLKTFYTTHDNAEMNKHFLDYINFGGYPEVIFSEKIKSNLQRYIKSDIVDKVLLRDLPSLYGIANVQELNSFFTTLAYYSGNEVSLEALCQSSGVDKNTLKKYLEYLKAAFLIKIVHRVDDSAKKFQRATFYKIYLVNPSLRSALFAPLESTDEMIGSMVETAIFAQWMHSNWFTPYYARWTNGKLQGEVDMVGLDDKSIKPTWAVEMKWSNRYVDKPNELKSLLYFCEKNKLKSALVSTLDKESTMSYKNVELSFMSCAMYAYTIGANTIEMSK